MASLSGAFITSASSVPPSTLHAASQGFDASFARFIALSRCKRVRGSIAVLLAAKVTITLLQWYVWGDGCETCSLPIHPRVPIPSPLVLLMVRWADDSSSSAIVATRIAYCGSLFLAVALSWVAPSWFKLRLEWLAFFVTAATIAGTDHALRWMSKCMCVSVFGADVTLENALVPPFEPSELVYGLLLVRLGSHVLGRMWWPLHAVSDGAMLITYHLAVALAAEVCSSLLVGRSPSTVCLCTLPLAGLCGAVSRRRNHRAGWSSRLEPPSRPARLFVQAVLLCATSGALLSTARSAERRVRWVFVAAYSLSSRATRFPNLAHSASDSDSHVAAVAAQADHGGNRPPALHCVPSHSNIQSLGSAPPTEASTPTNAGRHRDAGYRELEEEASGRMTRRPTQLATSSALNSAANTPRGGRPRRLSLARIIDGSPLLRATSLPVQNASRGAPGPVLPAPSSSQSQALPDVATYEPAPFAIPERGPSLQRSASLSSNDVLRVLDRLNDSIEQRVEDHHVAEFAQVSPSLSRTVYFFRYLLWMRHVFAFR